MLAEFTRLLRENGLDIQCPIAGLPKSCCNSQQVVFDFDAIKKKFLKNIGWKSQYTPKSADALWVSEEKNVLLFIEMKDITKDLEEIRKNNDENEWGAAFTAFFGGKFRPDKKIMDSFMLLLHLCQHLGIDASFFPRLIHEDCCKKFVFVLKVSSQQDYMRTYLYLAPFKHKLSYSYHKLEHIEFIPNIGFDTFMAAL